MKPKIARHYYAQCEFIISWEGSERLQLADLGLVESGKLHCAVSSERGPWTLEEMYYSYGQNNNVALTCREHLSRPMTRLAYPIDRSMTAEDIEGATHIEANPANDGWIFKHGTSARHQKHLIDVRNAVMAFFGPAIESADLKWKEAIDAGVNTATRIPIRQKLATLCAYRDDVLAAAIKAAEEHLHGHFVRGEHPEVDHVHAEVKAALSATKTKWAADPTILARYGTIRAEAVAITKLLAEPHEPETRAERAARIKAEKKAKEAEAQESNGD